MDMASLDQILQYVFGLLPDNVAADMAVILTFIVTLCTLILRFWKEPKVDSKWHGAWKLVHILASFRLPQKSSGKQMGTATATVSESTSKGTDSDAKK